MARGDNSIKNKDTYTALRRKGESKEKSARIANAQVSNHTSINNSGRKALPYEERTKEELYRQAQSLDISGRSHMSKEQLIEALRNH